MKRTVALLILMPLSVLGVDFLADLTQNRPDRIQAGSRTEVVLDVRIRHAKAPAALHTAQGLWGACQHTVSLRREAPNLVQVGAGRFQAVTEPALGEHTWRRLQGCLEDLTIDRVNAHVVSKRDFAPPEATD